MGKQASIHILFCEELENVGGMEGNLKSSNGRERNNSGSESIAIKDINEKM